MINLLKNIGSVINRVSEIICISFMGLMTFLVLLQIALRYFFHYSFPWTEEAVRYMMIWVTLVGSCIILQREEHFRLTLFIDRIPKKLSGIINLVLTVIVFLFLIVLLKEGFAAALLGKEMYTASLDISYFLPYFSIPLMCGIMLIHLVNIIIRDVIIFWGNKTRE